MLDRLNIWLQQPFDRYSINPKKSFDCLSTEDWSTETHEKRIRQVFMPNVQPYKRFIINIFFFVEKYKRFVIRIISQLLERGYCYALRLEITWIYNWLARKFRSLNSQWSCCLWWSKAKVTEPLILVLLPRSIEGGSLKLVRGSNRNHGGDSWKEFMYEEFS